MAANALDVASSWQETEAPVLGANGKFGARATAVKAASAGMSLLIEALGTTEESQAIPEVCLARLLRSRRAQIAGLST